MDGYNHKIEGPKSEILVDPSYFDLKIRQAHYTRGKDTDAQVLSSIDIPFEYWNINSTQYDSFFKQQH